MQYGQLTKPIKWILLHSKEKKELFELQSGNAVFCKREVLFSYGFRPKGDDYWLFKIKKEVKDDVLMASMLRQINGLKHFPQIIMLKNIK